jgi:hypothetical protein
MQTKTSTLGELSTTDTKFNLQNTFFVSWIREPNQHINSYIKIFNSIIVFFISHFILEVHHKYI